MVKHGKIHAGHRAAIPLFTFTIAENMSILRFFIVEMKLRIFAYFLMPPQLRNSTETFSLVLAGRRSLSIGNSNIWISNERVGEYG